MDVIYSEEELSKIATQLLENFREPTVWLFDGQMGAGKTTLIKSICTQLGVKDEMSSPTFSIVNEYVGETEMYHFDFYRIENPEELVNIGVEEYFFSGKRCFLEWPEVSSSFLPDDYLEISIKLVDDNTRHLIAKLHGPTFSKRIR